jgi:cell division protein FtsW
MWRVPLHYLRTFSPIFFFGFLVLISIIVFSVLGVNLGGATRWISLGPIAFQPSEFLKIAFILYFGGLLAKYHAVGMIGGERRREKKNGKRKAHTFSLNDVIERFHLKPLLMTIAVLGIVVFLLVQQPDMSTMGVIAISGMIMYFLSGTPLWHMGIFLGGGAGLIYLATKFYTHVASRLLVFLQPGTDPLGIGYQINQSIIGIGSGGILGVGLGMSGQKFGFIPEPMGDSVFAIFAEETGFLGSIFLFALYFLFFWQVIRIILGTKDPFSQLVASGIGCWILFQTFVNIGAMTGLAPLTGIPLPFVSYGGSHIVAELMAIGILLNIASKRSSQQPRGKAIS